MANKMIGWVKSKIGSSPFIKHIFTLVSGTAAAQAVGILLQPILGRIYGPAVTGDLAVYSSIVGILIAVAALRYDMTIILPKSDDEARQLKRLSTRSILVVSILATLTMLILYPYLASNYGPLTAKILLFSGVTIFAVADSTAIQYWFNRKLNYKAIAINRAQLSIGTIVAQILLGFAGLRSVLGLFLGMLIGQISAWVTVFYKSADLRKPVPDTTASIRSLALRYKKMPLLNGPNTLVDAVRFNGIVLLLAASFGRAAGGEFFKAWAITQAPIALINGAISQVFFQRLATVKRGEMRPLVMMALKRALLVGIVPMALFYFIAPTIVPLYLGPQWTNAGFYAKALVPWLYMQLASAPVAYIFVVTERQQYMLAFAILYACVPLTFLWLTPYTILATVQILSLLMAGLLMIMISMSLWVAKSWDEQPETKETAE